MAVRDIFKISRKTFLNPSGWIDLNALVAQNKTIWSILKSMFTKPQPGRKETFEAAMQRMGLAAADIASMISAYKRNAFLFLCGGFFVFIYSFYLLFKHHTFSGFVLGVSVVAYFWAQAFSYDFWALQLRRRTLGLTYADWKKSWLGE